jgi:hypothetical protein
MSLPFLDVVRFWHQVGWSPSQASCSKSPNWPDGNYILTFALADFFDILPISHFDPMWLTIHEQLLSTPIPTSFFLHTALMESLNSER